MLPLSLFADVGGVKTLILIALAIVIAIYLRTLSRREKKPAADAPLTAERLTNTPDDRLVNTVVRAMLADCDRSRPDPYRQTALWANAQVNVYSVWVIVKEQGASGFATLVASPAAPFLPLAADGFGQIGAPQCEAALRDFLAKETPDADTCAAADQAFAAAVSAEQPLTLCVPYIRDNAEAFVKDAPAA